MFRDITILSGELEIENILTIGDIFDYNLSWDFEEREEGRQYPGKGKIICDYSFILTLFEGSELTLRACFE